MDSIQIESDDPHWSSALAAALRACEVQVIENAEVPSLDAVRVLDEPDPERRSLRGCIVVSSLANRALLSVAARQSAAVILPRIPELEVLAALIRVSAQHAQEHRRQREQLARLGALLSTVIESHRRLRAREDEPTPR